MKTHSFKRWIAGLLSAALCLSAFLGLGITKAFAKGEQAEVCLVSFPREGDANYSTTTWGHDDIKLMNGWFFQKGKYLTVYSMGSYNGKICYCIEPSTMVKSGDRLSSTNETYWDNYPDKYNKTISGKNIKLIIGRILQYGYTGTISTSWRSQKSEDAAKLSNATATQLLIWETIVGERDAEFNHVVPKNCSSVLDYIRADNPLRSEILNYYNHIVERVQRHTKMPSFCSATIDGAQNIELKWDGNSYTATLTDTNNVLQDYTFSSSSSGVQIKVSGRNLIVTSSEAPSSPITIVANKNDSQRKGLVVWGDGVYAPGEGVQDLVTYVQEVDDHVQGFVNLNVSYGSAKIVKTSEDGHVDNITFTVIGNGVNQTVKTNSKGEIQIDNLMPGDYSVTEMSYDKYEPQESHHVTVVSGKTATVTFNNKLRRGDLKIIKSSEDNLNEGVIFHLYGTSLSGIAVDEYAVTDADGVATFEDVLISGAAPYTVEHNQTANDVTEQVAKGNVAIIKHTDNGDTQIETPENDAEFAVYLKAAGSYDNAKDTERDYLTCDENGFAQTKDMPYGIYTVHQVSGWEGSELMSDFDVFISQNGATYRYLINNAPFNSFIKIVKQDAETGKTIPYAGAGFKIYDPDGNPVTMTFTYPTSTNIDVFYTDDEGSLITPEKLPYGRGYSIVEVQAPYGYVLDETPIYFDVTQENSIEESGVTIIKVNKNNFAQKGTIAVEKTGEVFFGVSVSGGIDESGNELPIIYQPQYEKRGLPGAVYEVVAAEDIITPDGTVRNHKGDVVDTIITDENGIAMSCELYLGEYEVREVTAPNGMVLNPESRFVELVYAGQNVAVTETATSFENERQKVEISLVKSIEQNERFDIGTNGEMKNITFGLFSAEEIVSTSGTFIPADGLIEIVSLNEDGTATIKTDLPYGRYYVQEIATDSHYKLSDAKYPIIFEYVGQDTAVVKIAVNDGKAIKNDLIYGSVSGKKVDEDGNALGGAMIGLFRTDDGEFTKENALMTTTSAEDGSFSFENIPCGTWYVREIEQPTGFVLDDTIYPVTIGTDGQVVEIEIVNEYGRGNIHLTKVDSEYPDNKLTGAVFEVYKDSNNNSKLDEGDELLGTLTEKEIGEYGMNDLFYGRYFVKETKAPDGFVLDTDVYEVVIDTDGKTYDVENKAGVGFINEVMRGNLKIVKTSSDGKVKGFAFRITGANGYEIILETDENGEIFIEGLRIGDYTVSEMNNSASSMYVLPDDKTATVKSGATTIVEMHNVVRETPNTGEPDNLSLVLTLMGLSTLGIAASSFLRFKNKKKEEGN